MGRETGAVILQTDFVAGDICGELTGAYYHRESEIPATWRE